MHRPSLSVHLTLLLCLLLLGSCHAQFSAADYGRWFEGDGTYYGWTDAGNCAFRNRPTHLQALPAVAINEAQYAGSTSCGACVKFTGNGLGAGANPIVGTTVALVHDRCPECHYGSLDLSKSGDGRWKIKFTFVPCPFEDQLSFLFEGSHKWYWKIQARGLKYPIKSVSANGINGVRSQDNFFVMQNDGGHRLPTTVYVVDIMGRSFRAVIDRMDNDVDIKPRSVEGPSSGVTKGSPGGGSSTPSTPTAKPTKKPLPPRHFCVPKWKFCGANSWFRTTRCCHRNFHCKRTSRTRYQCVRRRRPRHRRRRRRCLIRYRRCLWNKYPCCGGMVCRKRRGWRYYRCLSPL